HDDLLAFVSLIDRRQRDGGGLLLHDLRIGGRARGSADLVLGVYAIAQTESRIDDHPLRRSRAVHARDRGRRPEPTAAERWLRDELEVRTWQDAAGARGRATAEERWR